MRSLQPAVIEIDVTYEELVILDAVNEGFSHTKLLPEDLFGSVGHPGVAIPAPFSPTERLRVRHVDRDVCWDVFAHLLNVDVEIFKSRAGAGEFSAPSSDDVPSRLMEEGRPWWSLGAVFQWLPKAPEVGWVA